VSSWHGCNGVVPSVNKFPEHRVFLSLFYGIDIGSTGSQGRTFDPQRRRSPRVRLCSSSSGRRPRGENGACPSCVEMAFLFPNPDGPVKRRRTNSPCMHGGANNRKEINVTVVVVIIYFCSHAGLLQSYSRGGRGQVEDMCYVTRRAEACAPRLRCGS
jgi:hypothetical protein